MKVSVTDVLAVANQFQFSGEFIEAVPMTHGHINDTIVVTYQQPAGTTRYVLQRINHHVFKNPVAVMDNIERVTRHIREKLTAAGATEIDRRVLTLVPTRAGRNFHVTAAGDFLTPAEKANLAFSGKLITFEIGIRFLIDFLEGDHYFKVHRASHNLDRCRTQFKLVESIEHQEAAMNRLVENL